MDFKIIYVFLNVLKTRKINVIVPIHENGVGRQGGCEWVSLIWVFKGGIEKKSIQVNTNWK